MKMGSSGNYGSNINGYSASTKPSKYSLYKNGLTGLKASATPRGYYSGGVGGTSGTGNGSIGGGTGSDRDSITGRSRKGKSRKPIGATKLDPPLYKKKNYDFTDYAHKEAVNRLKFLLADSYTPTKLSSSTFFNRHYEDSADDTESQRSERPAISEISKYIPNTSNLSRYNAIKRADYIPQKEQQSYLPPKSNISPQLSSSYHSTLTNLQNLNLPSSSSNPITTNTEQQPPPELLTFIEKQESYIEQLERESQYCRGELSSLLNKVKDVISENEALTDHARTGLSRPFFPGNNDSSDSEETLEEYPTKNIKKFKKPLDGPNIVFESRISELEAQLAQANIDIKKIHEENENNKRKLANGGGGGGGGGGGRFDSINIVGDDNLKKKIENMQRDRQTQEETIRKLMAEISKLKDSDATNFSKTQRNRDLAEQAMFERTQSDLEIRRLKDELERQHERIRELQHEMAKRIAEERSTAERRYNYQVDQLGGDLSNQWEQASKLQLELERQRRVEADYKRDLAQRTAQIEELKMEIKSKTTSFLSDLAQVNAEKQSLEQEIVAMRLQLERSDRQSRTETSRLNAEINSLRQRLDRADADLLHARRENLRLSDDVSNLEKEIAMGDINREPRMTSKDMTKIISELESKHATTVTDLEGMVQGQRQLMEKLTDECKTLTHKLEDTTIKHKNEMNALQTNVDYLTSKIISRDRIGNTNNNDNMDDNTNINNNTNDNNISYSGSNLNNDDQYDEAPQYGNTNFSGRSEPRDNNTNVAPIRRDDPSTSINYKSRDGIISGTQSRNQSPQQSLIEKNLDFNSDSGKRQIPEDYVSQSPTQQQQQQQQRPGSRTGDRLYPKERPESRTGERLYTKEQEYSGTDSIKPDRQRSSNVSPESGYRAAPKTDGPKEVTYSEPRETEYNKGIKQDEPYNSQMEYPVENQYEGNYQYPAEPSQGYDPNQYEQYATDGYGYETGQPQQYEPPATTGYDYQPQQYEQEYTQPSYRTDQYEPQPFEQPQYTPTADPIQPQYGSGAAAYAPTTTTSQPPYGGPQSNTNTTTSGYNQPIQSNANMGGQPAREQRFIADELPKPKQISPPSSQPIQQQQQYKPPTTTAAPTPSHDQSAKKFMPEQSPANIQNQPPSNNFSGRPQPKQ